MSSFFWYDYLIFFIVLAISSGTGIYYGCFGSKQRTVKEYLLGGKKMTALPIAISVAVRFGTCIFYTTIGGLKTVVWTDIFQIGIILLSLLMICVIGLNTTANFSSLWKTALDGGRLDILNFNLDPTLRDSFWTFMIGYTFHWMSYVNLSQSGVQKYLALPTFREWIWAMVFYVITMELVQIFCILLGLLFYAHYANCDPFISGKIQRHEQLLSYYAMQIAGHIPGVTGFTLVGLFCATMSTVSSSLNAISGVIFKDFFSRYWKGNIKEKTSGRILRLIVVITGIFSMFLIFLLQYLGDILPLAVSLASMGFGPTLGVFCLGLLFPKANAKGAFYGAVSSFIFQTFVFVVSKVYRYKKIIVDVPKTFSVSGCWTNTSLAINNTLSNSFIQPNNVTSHSEFKPFFIFRLSHFYITMTGLIVTLIVGLIISYLTNKKDPPVDDKELISPVIRRFLSDDTKSEIDSRELKNLMTKVSNTEET
ncbi:sodium-coupled monocarboxylate transporter 1-like [Tribolium madens]|uniref:sodium-coupled monocarboxylate transporter 1-like n=1 Tax=Tribolium madens TaxID=41895 RepID=UPI001CF735D7|nr:sodium-coupled monocarboxylate transporter 1-like [Tribolium madens]